MFNILFFIYNMSIYIYINLFKIFLLYFKYYLYIHIINFKFKYLHKNIIF